jgi:drug/metabolite transporter (DMT)-like permease
MNSTPLAAEWPGVWRMLVAMLLSGTIGWFVVESGQNIATVVFYRCLIGGFVLLLYLTVQRGWQQLNVRQSGYLLLGGLALVANWFCLFAAYHLSSISIATLVYHTQPFFLLLITALLQRQAPSATRWAWLALAFCGVALTTGLQFGDNHQQLWLGVGLAAVAACLYAIATLTTRKLTGIQPAQIAGLQMMLGVLLMLPLEKTSLNELAMPSLAALCTLGLVHTGLMYNLMYSAFQRLPVSSIAFLSFVYPLVAVLIDLWFYQVALSLLQVLGMCLILLAIVANQRQWPLWPQRTASA